MNKITDNKQEEYNDKQNNEKQKINLTADSGYSTSNNLAELEKEKYKERFEFYIPDAIYQNSKRNNSQEEIAFDKSKFIYHKDIDKFECPNGKFLNFVKNFKKRGYWIFHYRCNFCRNCPYFGKCTRDKRGYQRIHP